MRILFRIHQLRPNGFTIALAIMIATASALIVLVIARVLLVSSNQAVYLSEIQRTKRLAESGMSSGLGQIVLSPSSATANAAWVFGSSYSAEGVYQNTVYLRQSPESNTYWIITSATHTSGAGTFCTILNSYVQVSNVGDYLFAVSDYIEIGAGTNAGSGKVFGSSITFDTTGPNDSTVFSLAQYVSGCTPDPTLPTSTAYYNGGPISITNPPNQPVQLHTPLLFPQLLDSDLDYYQGLAHLPIPPLGTVAHSSCTFTGESPNSLEDVWPPGYQGVKDPSDKYPGHSSDNADHVYYCASTMTIGNVTIHGQILFVSSNTIFVTGPIIKAANGTTLPGSPYVSSSTAHEALLATRQSVIISSTFYNSLIAPPQIETIDAMLLVPNGSCQAVSYGDAGGVIESELRLDFTGSMILEEGPQLANIFAGGRTYTYDTDFANFPMPYLPALATIEYSFEKVTSGS